MQLKNKVKQKVLENSDSYNYYRNVSYEKLVELEKKVSELENSMDQLKEENDKINESTNKLLNTLLLDYELEVKGSLKNIQILCLELLNFIDNVSKKHGIQYWLDYGTLLGAVRHGGYIPWDDDIDIGMMRRDYEKFLEVIEDELKACGLDEYITVRRYRFTEKYYVLFIQVIYRHPNDNTILGGVDIFPYDFLKNPEGKTPMKFRTDKIAFINKLKEGISVADATKDYFEDMDLSYEMQEHFIGGAENTRGIYNRKKFVIMDTDRLFPLSTIKFDKGCYPCPHDNDYHLKKAFAGDYRRIPNTVLIHDDRNVRMRNSKKYEKLLLLHIDKLRKVNAAFK